jgi:hypothetical protein
MSNPKIGELGRATQFKPGHAFKGGRPKGSRDKISSKFFEDLYAVWEKHGLRVLERLAEEDPATLARITSTVPPKEIVHSTPESQLTDEQLEHAYALLLSGIKIPTEDDKLNGATH